MVWGKLETPESDSPIDSHANVMQQELNWLHRAGVLDLNVVNQKIRTDSKVLLLTGQFLADYPSLVSSSQRLGDIVLIMGMIKG